MHDALSKPTEALELETLAAAQKESVPICIPAPESGLLRLADHPIVAHLVAIAKGERMRSAKRNATGTPNVERAGPRASHACNADVLAVTRSRRVSEILLQDVASDPAPEVGADDVL